MNNPRAFEFREWGDGEQNSRHAGESWFVLFVLSCPQESSKVVCSMLQHICSTYTLQVHPVFFFPLFSEITLAIICPLTVRPGMQGREASPVHGLSVGTLQIKVTIMNIHTWKKSQCLSPSYTSRSRAQIQLLCNLILMQKQSGTEIEGLPEGTAY